MRTMSKSIKILIVVIAITAITIGIIYLHKVNQYKKTVANMTYSSIDISVIPDGVYIGECDVNFIYAKVEVIVKDGVITTISLLEHRHDRGSAASGIEQLIVEQQRVDVDAVSGATNSSQVIKKAVDNALNSATDS